MNGLPSLDSSSALVVVSPTVVLLDVLVDVLVVDVLVVVVLDVVVLDVDVLASVVVLPSPSTSTAGPQPTSDSTITTRRTMTTIARARCFARSSPMTRGA